MKRKEGESKSRIGCVFNCPSLSFFFLFAFGFVFVFVLFQIRDNDQLLVNSRLKMAGVEKKCSNERETGRSNDCLADNDSRRSKETFLD